MAEHTPGPWIVTGVSMTTGNISVGMKEHRIVIAEVTNAASFGDMLMGAMKRGGGGFDQGDCHTQHANARLIAAAPDLLKALTDILSNHETAGAGASVFQCTTQQVVAARAAVARATSGGDHG